MEPKPAVAVVFHHIGPYHHARLNAAADRLSVTGVEWSAKGYDAWGVAEAPARYHKISLFPEATGRYPDSGRLRQAFCSALEQVNPEIVGVNGWNNFGSLAAANCCVRRGIPMVVMSESARQDEARAWWKEMIKRRIVDFYSAALVGGQRHVEYLIELGMPMERIFTGYDVVDNEHFRQRAEEVRSQTEVWLAGELLSCVGAIHREEESHEPHQGLRGISRQVARDRRHRPRLQEGRAVGSRGLG